jgi:hypothetical protein
MVSFLLKTLLAAVIESLHNLLNELLVSVN